MSKVIFGKTNGDVLFAIINGPYSKKQHVNQRCGIDEYVDVVDISTGRINSVKLYENKKGKHFKKNGSHYISNFVNEVKVVPFQCYFGGKLVAIDHEARKYCD